MIKAQELLQKMGKQKFVEFVTHNQKGETMRKLQHRRRWGKNIKDRLCEHGIWVIQNYVFKGCPKCHEVVTKNPDFQPHFNIGLGAWIESPSEMRKEAKRQGKIQIGTERL